MPFLIRVSRAVLVVVVALLCTPALAQRTVMVFGDSLSAAYGIAASRGWVSLLGERISKAGLGWRVVNASISGETTAGGLRRLPEDLKRHKPDIVVIALGGNDALRGQPLAAMRANLEQMIRLTRQARAEPVLAGMMIPPNYGIDYAREFRESYVKLAEQHRVAIVPFLLAGMEDRRDLFQPDQVHPTAEAQALICENVWPTLEPLLRRKK